MSEIKANRTRTLRYKRPALASMGYDEMRTELWNIREACTNIRWLIDQGDKTLLNALGGDDEQLWEFKMTFTDLEAKADRLAWNIENYNDWSGESPERTYNDCTVALIGDRYKTLGYDGADEDYSTLTSYEQGLAFTEAGKRLMRRTKAEMLSTIGQCMGMLLAFLDLRQQYDYLKATFDILRDENTSLLKSIKELNAVYDTAAGEWEDHSNEAVQRFDVLLESLPDQAWIG